MPHDINLNNASAKLLALMLNQPENINKPGDIIRAGEMVRAIDDYVGDAPQLTKSNPTAEEVTEIRARVKGWEATPFVLCSISTKSLDLAKSVVGKMVEKGKLGASRDVCQLLSALGFSADD